MAGSDDGGDASIHVLEHLVCGQAEGFEAAFGQYRVARDVLCRLIASVVSFAVDLNREAGGKAGKVDSIRRLGHLPAEAVACRALLKLTPK
ncbi:tryptophanase [Novosphingobium fluoreni]|uniref:Tryptophanase n=1 Tax=Novosphingobium fluoreni TaxID=1391222 RepID=A0A7W6BXS5_9SPHN|nr:tryptophanase [Novosphingobium fluoreni]